MRDTTDGIETLLLRRNSKLAFHGGAWVFPGGRIDPEDYSASDPPDDYAAACRAAVRESYEEAGLTVQTDDLVYLSHWTTPIVLPKRFSTWFFIAAAGLETVRVDGGEIHAHRWMRPHDALDAQRAGEIELPPPTFVTLLKLQDYSTAGAALAAIAAQEPEVFLPQHFQIPGGACTVYRGDASFDHDDIDRPGPRHRLYMIKGGWRYEHTF
jgi:8-oxo-dGTP pyrophosphatase MutT (NUDIX family)